MNNLLLCFPQKLLKIHAYSTNQRKKFPRAFKPGKRKKSSECNQGQCLVYLIQIPVVIKALMYVRHSFRREKINPGRLYQPPNDNETRSYPLKNLVYFINSSVLGRLEQTVIRICLLYTSDAADE